MHSLEGSRAMHSLEVSRAMHSLERARICTHMKEQGYALT